MKSLLKLLMLMAGSSAFTLNDRARKSAGLSAESKGRRNILQQIILCPTLALLDPMESEAAFVNGPTAMENGMLESRVLENVLSPPPYGLDRSDIYYPSYFNGVWNVDSITTDILAPCGVPLFGGNNTYTRALTEVSTSLRYKARFVASASETSSNSDHKTYVADREYNVVEIAKAAMGENSVLNVPLSTPNKVSIVLTPNGAQQILKADLITLNRRSESINSCEFHCSEVVRQIIAPAKSNGVATPPMSPPSRSTLLKEIETTSLYTAVKDDVGNVSEIRCRQRSATFILPSQSDPMMYRMWEATRGRPIDVRFYNVIYTKRI